MSAASGPEWLLLASSLPGREAGTARVKLWRTLKDAGAASLRDGVALIPATAATRQRIADIVGHIEKQGGAAWLFAMPGQSPVIERKLRSLFDRRIAYQEVARTVAAARNQLGAQDEATVRRRYREIEAAFSAVAALDFFPGAPQVRTKEGLDRLRSAIDRRFSPAEPSASSGGVSRRDSRRFQGATWATRKRPWVDRVASAWVIRRFIDPRARFVWLEKPGDCPRDAHGFDFDGAAFTHVGDLVTFEVLLAAFGLTDDPGLSGLARLVHFLDVGGDVVAEAAGFEAVLAGLRERCADDDELFEAATSVLDALYEHYTGASR